ncbi:MAG: LL-diaminopimelate aminotransferase [Clostridiales bacterium]|nr:LL-diaminopimelate aminotransferase [Clostridiales bacterium]
MKLNKNFKNLQENYLFAEVAKRVEQYKAQFPAADLISLGIGDVTLPLSPKCIDACKEAATDMSTKTGFHGYGPYDGYAFLKNAIVDYYKLRGISIHADEVFVTDGAKNGIGNFLDLFDADNTVMIPDPVYPAYVDANVLSGHKIIYVDANKDNGFLAMPPVKKTKVDIIYICSPNNPTGAAYTKDQLKAWVDYALDNKAVILYDAAYEAYIEGNDIAHSIFEITGSRECAVEFCSFSKMAGFTGVRCGWTVIPMESPLNRMWLHRQSIKFNGTSYIVQRMAERALRGGYEDTKRMVATYKDNAKIITKKFDALKIEYTGGINAPYIWFNCGIDSWEFFDYLLKKARIVCTPGSGFGKNGKSWVRFTSFNSKERTEEAMNRFETSWKEFLAVKDKLYQEVN